MHVKYLVLGRTVVFVKAVTDVMSFLVVFYVYEAINAGRPATKIGSTLCERGYCDLGFDVRACRLCGLYKKYGRIIAGSARTDLAVVKDKGTAVPVGVGLNNNAGRYVVVAQVVADVVGLVGAVCMHGVSVKVCVVVACLDGEEVVGDSITDRSELGVVNVALGYRVRKSLLKGDRGVREGGFAEIGDYVVHSFIKLALYVKTVIGYVDVIAVFGISCGVSARCFKVDRVLTVRDLGDVLFGHPNAEAFINMLSEDARSFLRGAGVPLICDHVIGYAIAVYGYFINGKFGGDHHEPCVIGNHQIVYNAALVSVKLENLALQIIDGVLVTLVAARKHKQLVADNLYGKSNVAKVMCVSYKVVTAI